MPFAGFFVLSVFHTIREAVAYVTGSLMDLLFGIRARRASSFEPVPTGLGLELALRSGRISAGEFERCRDMGWISPRDIDRLRKRAPEFISAQETPEMRAAASDEAMFRLVLRNALGQWGRHREMRSSLAGVAEELGVLPLWQAIARDTDTRPNARALRTSIVSYLDSKIGTSA
ncbi:hypothetical protein [Mycetocola saprophilus]|uniref:hypothetical protein n=1 Tax=Mycetocola saprophilus TaxID=76636 RepID=UPI0012DBCBF1|nr:hypothetical protein [Mycetocola saprophilus]